MKEKMKDSIDAVVRIADLERENQHLVNRNTELEEKIISEEEIKRLCKENGALQHGQRRILNVAPTLADMVKRKREKMAEKLS